jgi:beta-lactamase class A
MRSRVGWSVRLARILAYATVVVAVWAAFPVWGQVALPRQIRAIGAKAQGRVQVACALPGGQTGSGLGFGLDCDVNAEAHAPMQSVFKLPLTMTVLHLVEQGKLSLNEPIRFTAADLFVPKAYSPLQDRYPQAGVDVPLRELLRLTVGQSDNAAADLLLRTVGGVQVVDAYMASLGVTGFRLVDSEHALHRDPGLQYRDWFTPAGAVVLLRRLSDDSPLTREDTALLLQWMRPPEVAAPDVIVTKRLQADLPPGTVVAHKSGSSGRAHGLAVATNDIALMTLPDGRRLAMAVFVTDARAGDAVLDGVIAAIGRAVYDTAVKTVGR